MEKVITIDGLASSGKSTLSQLLAKKLQWPWLSTGILYRGLAYIGFKENFNEQDYLQFFQTKDWSIRITKLKSLFFYKGEDISPLLYEEKIDEQASLFSSKTIFRKALIPIQENFFAPYLKKGIILEGRDCGTILFPLAPLKIFLQAGANIRAERRAQDRNQDQKNVFQAQAKRDTRDQTRLFAPFVQPKNSLCLDSSRKSPEELADYVYKEACRIFSLRDPIQ